jgi:hypothetical protein|tara:strand:+ start:2947 stop:3162 length:216 start_codon:yes stop_codon:yes gene_type:complete
MSPLEDVLNLNQQYNLKIARAALVRKEVKESSATVLKLLATIERTYEGSNVYTDIIKDNINGIIDIVEVEL